MEKKLFYKFSDGEDYTNIVLELDACMEWIKADMESAEQDEEREFTITPVWMTDEEFSKLPEHD